MLTNNRLKKDSNPSLLNLDDDFFFWLVFSFTLIIGFGTRLYKIEEPDHVW